MAEKRGWLLPWAALVLSLLAATGCSSIDRRSTGALVDDQTLEFRAGSALRTDERLGREVHINVTSVNGILLLTGEVPTEEQRALAGELVSGLWQVRGIRNEVVVGPLTNLASRAHDAWLTTKVKTRLFGASGVDGARVKVVTENGAVFLLGLVTRGEAEAAVKAAAATPGVRRVVKVFEYVE